MKNICMGRKWKGRPYTVWKGDIRELRKLVPTFTISDFSIGDGANEFLSVIAREPLDEINIVTGRNRSGEFLSIIPQDRDSFDEIIVRAEDSIGKIGIDEVEHIDEVDPKGSMRVPVATVRKEYIDLAFRKDEYVLKGYKLLQHREALDSILKTLEDFSSNKGRDFRRDSKVCITPLRDPASLKAELKISKYGARMQIEFLVPQYKFYLDNENPFILKVVCVNSVDKSMALDIKLFWHLQSFDKDIPIAGIHKRNDQDLNVGVIERFLRFELDRLTTEKWLKPEPDISPEKAEEVTKSSFGPDNSQKIWGLYYRLLKENLNELNEVYGVYEEVMKIIPERRGINLLMLGFAIEFLELAIAKDPEESRNLQRERFFSIREKLLKAEKQNYKSFTKTS